MTTYEIKALIVKDEYEACFDKNYCSDENWELCNEETREQAFSSAVKWINDASLKELKEEYGDRYSFEKVV